MGLDIKGLLGILPLGAGGHSFSFIIVSISFLAYSTMVVGAGGTKWMRSRVNKALSNGQGPLRKAAQNRFFFWVFSGKKGVKLRRFSRMLFNDEAGLCGFAAHKKTPAKAGVLTVLSERNRDQAT